MKRELNPPCFAKEDVPYSHGIACGNMIFTTQVGEDATGAMVSGDVYEQTKQTLLNAKEVLKEAGATMSDIVKVTIYMLDMKNEFGEMNRAYREFMPSNPFPARACVQVAGMIPGVKVEMEFTAMVEK